MDIKVFLFIRLLRSIPQMCATEGAKVIATDMNGSQLEELKREDTREPRAPQA